MVLGYLVLAWLVFRIFVAMNLFTKIFKAETKTFLLFIYEDKDFLIEQSLCAFLKDFAKGRFKANM